MQDFQKDFFNVFFYCKEIGLNPLLLKKLEVLQHDPVILHSIQIGSSHHVREVNYDLFKYLIQQLISNILRLLLPLIFHQLLHLLLLHVNHCEQSLSCHALSGNVRRAFKIWGQIFRVCEVAASLLGVCGGDAHSVCMDLQALCFRLGGLRIGFELVLEFDEASWAILKLDILRGSILHLAIYIGL